MKHNFKVGDEVIVDPKKCTTKDLRMYSSTGTIGEKYTITTICNSDCRLKGKNYHKYEWLSLATVIHIGGE